MIKLNYKNLLLSGLFLRFTLPIQQLMVTIQQLLITKYYVGFVVRFPKAYYKMFLTK